MGYYTVNISYQKQTVFSGELWEGRYMPCVDALICDAMARFNADSIVWKAKDAVLSEASFSCYGDLLLLVDVASEGNATYIYTAEGERDVLDDFRREIERLGSIKGTYELTVTEDSRTVYRGERLALVDLADKLYRDSLLKYAQDTEVVSKSINRSQRVLDVGNKSLALAISYNDFSVKYAITGPALYISEVDYYFKGIYEDFDNALKSGETAGAYVCGSISEITSTFGTDVMDCIWFPTKMDGTLTGEYGKLESETEILDKAVRFCRLGVPDFGDGTKVNVEYVCDNTCKVVERSRDGALRFFTYGTPDVFALEVYARVYVDGEHFVTYGYRVQNKLLSRNHTTKRW